MTDSGAPLSRAVRIDWFRLLSDLKRRGLSTREVARRVTELTRDPAEPPVAEAHLRHYANGGEPRFHVAYAIINLWREANGKPADPATLEQWLEGVPLEGGSGRHRAQSKR